jgi:hypothetical protein
LTGGLNACNAKPAVTIVTPRASIATVVETCVATSTPSIGPAMYDNSIDIESSEYAARRCSSGTSAASDWRTTENTGSANNPITNAATSSTGYGSHGAENQNTASATIDTDSIRRKPCWSTTRPSHGAPTALATVAALPTSPAAA